MRNERKYTRKERESKHARVVNQEERRRFARTIAMKKEGQCASKEARSPMYPKLLARERPVLRYADVSNVYGEYGL